MPIVALVMRLSAFFYLKGMIRMTLFESVKDSVTTRQVAEEYGFEVKRNGMMCCPFHDDRNPSMKVDKRFHCFGCGEDGDVIDFVGKLFSLSSKESADRIAHDFGISYDEYRNENIKLSVLKRIHQESITQKENEFMNDVCSYYRQLRIWKHEFAPKHNKEELNPLFVEALLNMHYIDELIHEFMSGTEREKSMIMADCANKFKRKSEEIMNRKIKVCDANL